MRYELKDTDVYIYIYIECLERKKKSDSEWYKLETDKIEKWKKWAIERDSEI